MIWEVYPLELHIRLISGVAYLGLHGVNWVKFVRPVMFEIQIIVKYTVLYNTNVM